jgi:hypothetical protein
VSASVSTLGPAASCWIDDGPPGKNGRAFSFPTPVSGTLDASAPVEENPAYCGRVTFTDVHAGGGGQPSDAPVPASCMGGTMTAEEKTLEYLFFNLGDICHTNPIPRKGPPPF